MKKVILTKEQVEAIEYLKEEGWNFENVLTSHYPKGFKMTKEAITLNKLTSEELALAWLNGYEVEKSVEEKILEEYKRIENLKNKASVLELEFRLIYGLECIKEILNIQGIKIEGINC